MFPKGLDGTLLSRMASNPWYVPNAAKHQVGFPKLEHKLSPRVYLQE